MFTPAVLGAGSGEAKVKYRPPSDRVVTPISNNSSVTAPDVEDTLRRVAVVIYQHILRGVLLHLCVLVIVLSLELIFVLSLLLPCV